MGTKPGYLRLIAEARARGVDVTIDQYPFTASSAGPQALLPQWSLEGGKSEIAKRLDDPPTRARIKAAIVENIKFDRGGGDPKNVFIARREWDRGLEGKNLEEIAAARGRSSSFEDAAETTMEIVGKGDASAIFHAISEDDLVRILKDPLTMIASDGGVEIPGVAFRIRVVTERSRACSACMFGRSARSAWRRRFAR